MPLYRIDAATNTVVCLCMDPLCLHNNEECPFYGLLSFACLPDDSIAMICRYWKGDEAHERFYFKIYDQKTGRITMQTEFAQDGSFGLGPEIVSDGKRLYLDSWHDTASENDRFPLYEMDLKTGDKTPFSLDEDGKPSDFTDQLLCMYGDRYFYTDYETIYSMKQDGTDIRTLCTLSQRNSFCPINVGGDHIYLLNKPRNSVIRISLADGTETVIGLQTEYTDSFQVTRDYIYYFSGEETVLGKARISGYAADEVILPGGELWRCDHNGENHEMLFRFEDEYSGLRPLEWRVVGECFYCSYYQWIDSDGDGVYRDGDHLYSYPQNGKTSWEMFFCNFETKDAGILNIQ